MRARNRRARAILQRRSRITRGMARRRRVGIDSAGVPVWSASGLHVFMIRKYAPAPSGFHDLRPAEPAPRTKYQEFHAEDCGNCWLIGQDPAKPYYCNKTSCDQ